MRVLLPGVALFLVVTGCGPQKLPARVDSSFKMERDSLAFPNFVTGYDGSAIDAEAMRRMFGDGVCSNGGSPCLLTPGARAFMDDANAAMTGGRCEGFAVLASLLEAKKLKVEDFGASTARELKLDGNVTLQRELAYWFSTQLVPSAVAEKTKKYMAKEVMPVLAEALGDKATERYRIGIVRKKGAVVSGGHSLTPLGYYRDPKNAAVYWVRVYDNNNPDGERLLKVDTAANRWEFEAAENPKRGSRLYYGDDSNQNPLYLAPVFSRQGQLPCPFCAEGGAQVVSQGGAQVVVDTPAGPVGLSEGEFVASEGTSVSPSFSAEFDTEPTSVVIGVNHANLGGMSQVTAHVSAKSDPENPDALQAVGVLNSQIRSAVSDLKVTANDTFSAGATGARYENNSRTDLALSTEVPRGTGTLSVTARVNGGSDDVSTNIDSSTGSVSVAVGGATGAEVVVVVKSTDENGGETSAQLTFVSNGDAGLVADTAALADGGTLTGVVDNAGTTVTVTDACTDGKLSGSESDVDCGQVCTTKCELGRACLAAADCASGLCQATTHLCVADACADGARSSGETDIDCGGTSCAPCALQKACGGDGDCASGACRGSVCVPTFALGVAVTGVPLNDPLTLANGSDSLVVNGDGTFAFPTRITGAYAVTVATQPASATCTVANASGTATSDVQLTVTCTQGFRLGGTASGLGLGEQLILQNGSDVLPVFSNGAFTFATPVSGSYSVTVNSAPAGKQCYVTNGSGTATADVTTVVVFCTSSGRLDSSFNTTGWFSTSLSAGSDFLTRGIVNVDNTMVVVGQTAVTTTDVDWVAMKLMYDGTRDQTFGDGGVTTLSHGVGIEYPRGVFLDGTGYVVVGGLFGTNADVGAARLNADGTLDTTWGIGGFRLHDSGQWEYVEDAVRDNLGRFLLVGRRSPTGTGPHDVIVTRLNADGTLDTTFGTNGWFVWNGGGDEGANSVAFDTATQDILVLAQNGTDSIVLRLLSTGALWTAFGTQGVATIDLSGAGRPELPYRLATALTNIVVVGRADGPTTSDLAIARLDSMGALDPTFGTGGRLLIDRGRHEVGYSLAAVPSGGWYVGGHSGNFMLVTRITTAGAVDTTFANNGFFENVLSNSALAYHLMLDAVDHPVAVGTIRVTGSEDLGVARILP